jgi:DNA-binding SARP family transcriptional activator
MGAGGTLEFGILGPLVARRDGETVQLGGAKQRAVLAILLLNANRFVSTDLLIEQLWPDKAPGKPQTAIQGYVSELRKQLEPDRPRDAEPNVVVTEAGGYSIRLQPAQLDLHRFEHMVESSVEASVGGRVNDAAAELRAALDLWRGPPLADFTYEAFAQAPIARLDELRLAALERRIDADLARGRHAELVGELHALTAEHPLREGLWGKLMLALYRSGRQADALAAYQAARTSLVEELGIEPGPPLQRLEHEILLQDESIAFEPAGAALPNGLITLVFTDIAGSTRLVMDVGDGWPDLLAEHRRLMRTAVRDQGGREVDRQGDGFFFVFEDAEDAVAAAVAAQRAHAEQVWPDGADVRVRIGIHTGEPRAVEDGYAGIDVHRAARICAAANGGQVLLSRDGVAALAEQRPAGVDVRSLGAQRLRGLPEPEELFQLAIDGLSREFPPLRVEEAPALEQPERSILAVVVEKPSTLLAVAEPLARSRVPHEVVLIRLVESAAASQLGAATQSLQDERVGLAGRGVTTRVGAFTTQDRASDIIRLATRPEVDLLLLEGPPELRRSGALGAELEAVLVEAPCDVAFLSRRQAAGTPADGPVLVPFGAGEHDWAALELGAWIASAGDRALRLLGTSADSEGRDASRMLADASLLLQRSTGVAAEPALVGAGQAGVVEAAGSHGLLVVGVSERWAAEGLGLVRWGIAKEARVPVLFVRRGLRPGGLAPAERLTRFTWSAGPV